MRRLLLIGVLGLLAAAVFLHFTGAEQPASPVATEGGVAPEAQPSQNDDVGMDALDPAEPFREPAAVPIVPADDALAAADPEAAEGAGGVAESVPKNGLSGELIGYSGYRVPQFSVQASPEEPGAMTLSAVTDPQGYFQFSDLPPDDYRLHHVYHSSAARSDLPLIRPPARQVAVLLEQPTLLIRPVGPGGDLVRPEDLVVYWGGEKVRDMFSSESPPSARLQRLSDGRTLAILDKPGPWKVLAFLPSDEGDLRALERLEMQEEHRELTLSLAAVETRLVTIELVDSNGVPVEDWTAKAWSQDAGLPVEESPLGSHQLKLPIGSWKVRLKPTEGGYLSAFDAEVEVGLNDPESRTESVTAPGVWGRLEGEVDDLSSTYRLLAVHEAGGRYSFTHKPKEDGAKWSSWLLKPGSYAVSIRRIPARSDEEEPVESLLEIQAVVQSGVTTSLDFSADRFR